MPKFRQVLTTAMFLFLGATGVAPGQDSPGDGESKSPSTELRAGETAPDFKLLAEDGSYVSLSDFRGRNGKNVVLVFMRAHW